MKLNPFSIISLITGVCSLVAGVVLPAVAIQAYTAENGAIGIIGGADMPTAVYVATLLLKRWPLCLILLGIALIITGIFCLAFSKTVKEHCAAKTFALSMAISAVGGMGLVSALMWNFMAGLRNTSTYPVMYPLSIVFSVVCVIAFVALVAWYCKERKNRWSWKGVLIDLLTCVLYSPVFFYGFSMLWN